MLLSFDFPFIDTSVDTPPEAAIVVIALIYVVAAVFNLAIPDTGARYPHQERNPLRLLVDFSHCFVTLWRDKLGQISLAVTTLFWGAGATPAVHRAQVGREAACTCRSTRAPMLPGVSAVGIALGAVLAARLVPLKRAVHVLPFGHRAWASSVIAMVFVKWMPAVYVLLVLVGRAAPASSWCR